MRGDWQGTTAKSQNRVAGALGALAVKHFDNRQLIVKRLVGLLTSLSARANQVRVQLRVIRSGVQLRVIRSGSRS